MQSPLRQLRTACSVLVLACCCLGAHAEESGPVAYWAFEGRSRNTAVDATGNAHELVLTGTKRIRGAIGRGLHFAGGGSGASTPLTADLQSPPAVTVQAWVRPDEVRQDVEGAGIVYAGNYLIRITRGTPSFHVFTTGWKPILAKGEFTAGEWYCLVGTYDGAEMCIYVNGKLAGALPRQGDIPFSNRPVLLGRQTNPFVGVIDEVRIHTRCLTAAEVQAAFAADVEKQKSGGVWVSPRDGRKDALVLPPEFAKFTCTPLPEASVRGSDRSVLAIRGAIPRVSSAAPETEDETDISDWSLAESLGCPWLQIWPLPSNWAGWRALDQALAGSRLKGQAIALPLPMHAAAMDSVWKRLQPHGGTAEAIIVCNGAPDSPNAPLASWHPHGNAADWAVACARGRQLTPNGTKLLLARLPLLGSEAPSKIAETASAIRGTAEGICVSVSAQDSPESEIEPALRHAQSVARAAKLELWLDAEGWEETPTAHRCAYFLRLLAMCQAAGVRLTWWPRNGLSSAFLDADGLPTTLYDAAHVWQRLVGNATDVRTVTEGGIRKLVWSDEATGRHVAWWRPDGDVRKVGQAPITLPKGTVIVDPLHGHILEIPEGTPPPLCSWPLIARAPLP